MAKATVWREDLTPEGQKMWDNLINYEKIAEGKSILPKERLKKIEVNIFEVGLIHMRTELRRMIKNSELVVRDCEEIIRTYKTKEEYLTSDAKVAMTIHENLIKRLTRVLDYMPAFEHNIFVDDEPLITHSIIDLTKDKKVRAVIVQDE